MFAKLKAFIRRLLGLPCPGGCRWAACPDPYRFRGGLRIVPVTGKRSAWAECRFCGCRRGFYMVDSVDLKNPLKVGPWSTAR